MPKVGLKETFELQTRNTFTKVSAEIGMTVEGRELPSMEVLGAAFEKAIFLVQQEVTNSYKVVPPRVTEPPQPAADLLKPLGS